LETIMSTSTSSRIALTAALTGTAAIISLAGASSASASSYNAVPLSPGQSSCVSQYASYQVRGEGTATGAGARFKLLYNGQVIDATPGRVNNWVVEHRSAWGNFPGPGYYSVCAYNTATTNTIVTLRIRTDSEF
jgi:hypothetical protein